MNTITTSTSVWTNSKITNLKAINNMQSNRQNYKSVDQLYNLTEENDQPAIINSNRENQCFSQLNRNLSEMRRNNRNSKSEESLFDSENILETLSANSRLKSNSCEGSNEFKKQTENLLGRALEERLKLKNLKSPSASENNIEFNETDISDCACNSEQQNNCNASMMPPLQPPQNGVTTDSHGLIVPKKLVNPCLESGDRKNLHRELMFNQKIGKNVLNQKTELQRALQKQKERQFIQTQVQQQRKEHEFNGELDRVIMQRAQRLEGLQNKNSQDDITNKFNPEYLNARAKLRTTVDSK